MKKFYVTLARELQGYCIIAYAPSEMALRLHLIANYGKLWCSVYTEIPSERIIGVPLYVGDEGED